MVLESYASQNQNPDPQSSLSQNKSKGKGGVTNQDPDPQKGHAEVTDDTHVPLIVLLEWRATADVQF